MRLQIIGTFAAGLAIAALPAFAQTPETTPTTTPPPAIHGNPDRAQDHAAHHEQWDDCMAREEAKYGGVKTVGPHAGANNKGNWKALSKGKPMPPDEKLDAKKGEKENRHQAEMDTCRQQLYGRDGPAPGKK